MGYKLGTGVGVPQGRRKGGGGGRGGRTTPPFWGQILYIAYMGCRHSSASGRRGRGEVGLGV